MGDFKFSIFLFKILCYAAGGFLVGLIFSFVCAIVLAVIFAFLPIAETNYKFNQLYENKNDLNRK